MATRRVMRADLTQRRTMAPIGPVAAIRPLHANDVMPLAQLMHSAYRDSPDSDGDTPGAATNDMKQAFAGAFGPIVPAATLGMEGPSGLASAVIVTTWKAAPLIAFLMSAPQFRRRGYARLLLSRSMDALAAAGESEVLLVVTRGNTPAEALYEQAGFADTDPVRVQ